MKQDTRRPTGIRCMTLAAMAAMLLVAGAVSHAETAPPAVPSLPEAKRMVRMMDDIYITAVLTTHKMYVQDPGTPSAVTWAKQVITKLKGRGWPEARIFSATNRPLHPDNAPDEEFERDAIQAFNKGTKAFEATSGNELRYATEVRAVDKSCLQCHVRNKVGDLLGGVDYRIKFAPAAK